MRLAPPLGCLLALLIACSGAVAQPVSKVGELRGVWTTEEGVPTWDETMASLALHNFNAVFPYVATAGVAFYPSDVLPVAPSVAERGDFLADCVAAGRRHGIHVHARLLAFFVYRAPQEVRSRYAAEDRYMRDVKGRVIERWLCPSKHVNRRQLVDAVGEIAARYDVDGVQLDYFRYPWFTGCYCPSCKYAFERDLKLKVERWPQDVASGGPLRMDYLAWRQASLTRLLRDVRERALKERPGLRISAAVFPNWGSHRYSFGQDWRTWVQLGLLDFVCPMDYVSTRARLADWAARQVRWVDHRVPVCIGIGVTLDDSTLPPAALIEQVQASREAGADGFVLFKYSDELAARHLPALSAGLTSAPPISAGLPAGVRVSLPAAQALGGRRTVLADEAFDVRVRLSPGVAASGKLNVYTVEGRFVEELGDVDSAMGRAFRASVSLQPGAFRPAFVGDADGRPVVAWGPVARVVTGDELGWLRRKYRLPNPGETRLKVAILADGRGADPIYDVLANDGDLRPFIIEELTDEALDAADVLILPQLSGGPYALTHERVAAVREWVEDGGGLLTTHDAVGYKGFPAIVPAVCKEGVRRARSTDCVVAARHPIFDGFAKGAVFRHSYKDHVILRAGSNGEKLLAHGKSPAGDPVLLAGSSGRGLAVACGIMLGAGSDGAPTALPADERAILLGSVKWLGGLIGAAG